MDKNRLETYTKDEDYPLVPIDFQPHCCSMAEKHFKGSKQHYIRVNDASMKRLDGKMINGGRYDIAAILDLKRWESFEEYMAGVKRKHKGAAIRHANKARKEGYCPLIFPWKMYIPDIVEINHSKPVRCGKPMREGYLRTIEEMGGYPKEPLFLKWGSCKKHHVVNWGIFMDLKNHCQGDVLVNRKLLAYIKFLRLGEMALYTMILGHGDYLKYGVMYYLHFEIIRWVYACFTYDHPEQRAEWVKGLRYVCYAQYFSGNHGLRQWKKKVLFEPARLIVYD